MKLRHPVALVVSALVVLLVYKCIATGLLGSGAIALGFVLEGALLILLGSLGVVAARVRSKPFRVTGAVLFYALFHLVVACLLVHAYFFESAAERRLSLLELDLRTVGYFFTSVLPPRGALLLGGLILLIHLGALVLLRRRSAAWGPPWRWAAGSLAVAVLLMTHGARVPSPVADMVLTAWDELTTPKLVVDHTRPGRYLPALLDHGQTTVPVSAPTFDKVLVFVMESMPQSTLDRETRALPASTFARSGRPHAHVHTRYFATNQDSLGYRTAFAVSQQEVELVVRDLHWDEVMHYDLADTARLARSHLCFVPYEFEHGCEDRALLPRVLDFLDHNPRAFLYQEFIWGHVTAYNEASGRTNTDYYSSYLDAVIDHLVKTGQLDRTLIVLTSDHGFRYKAWQSQRDVSQIPLWFHSPRFQSTSDGRLLSHLDFKDLLLHELFPAVPDAKETPFVMVMGPTGMSFVTVVTQPGEFLLVKARPGGASLVHAEGYSDVAGSRAAASEFLRLYEDYLGYFGRL